jgi:hypothetical protein
MKRFLNKEMLKYIISAARLQIEDTYLFLFLSQFHLNVNKYVLNIVRGNHKTRSTAIKTFRKILKCIDYRECK